MEKGSASARKPPLPPRRQRMDEKASAAARKPPLPPRRQRTDEKSSAARNPPLPLRRKRMDDKSRKSPLPPRQRKSGETPNRTWVADQLRCEDRYIKATSNLCVSLVRDMYNVRGDWPDEFIVDFAQFLITKVQSVEKHDNHDQSSSPKGDILRLVYPLFQHFALLLLSLCKVDQNLWSDHLIHHLIQYIVMKLRSTTQPLESLDADADASPSKKLKGS